MDWGHFYTITIKQNSYKKLNTKDLFTTTFSGFPNASMLKYALQRVFLIDTFARHGSSMLHFLSFLIIILFISGCSTSPSPTVRNTNAEMLAASSGWAPLAINTTPLPITAFLPSQSRPATHLNVYIEGDGMAWISRSKASSDPTPVTPLALQLALKDKTPSVYLGRPCQYADAAHNNRCQKKWWTNNRFAPEIVTTLNHAVDKLKQHFDAQTLTLVGYSGGSALAVLIAAERNDVTQIITIAGNLDTHAWTEHHRVSPLVGSLNPADAWQHVANIPQTHFVGSKDNVMPKEIAQSYARRFPSHAPVSIQVIDGYDHQCCWLDNWPISSASHASTKR